MKMIIYKIYHFKLMIKSFKIRKTMNCKNQKSNNRIYKKKSKKFQKIAIKIHLNIIFIHLIISKIKMHQNKLILKCKIRNKIKIYKNNSN
jgi:hypothetical protein